VLITSVYGHQYIAQGGVLGSARRDFVHEAYFIKGKDMV